MANITVCSFCGECYEAYSEECANEIGRKCVNCSGLGIETESSRG